MSNPNKDIVSMLRKLAKYERNECLNEHRYYALNKAAEAVRECEERLTSGEEARKLQFVGPKIAKKIDDFLKNGDDSPMPPSGTEEKAAKATKTSEKSAKKRKQQDEPETKPVKKVSKKRGRKQ